MFHISIRKIFVAILFIAASYSSYSQVCVIDTNNFELIYPPSEGLPCIERGVPYSATIQFFSLPSIGGFPVDSILITSFLNLPNGIHYSLRPMPCKLYPYDRGCVYFSGTTSDIAGSYLVDYNGFAYAQAGTVSFDWLKANFGGVLPEYSFKVIEPGANCPNTPSGINALDSKTGFSVYPNPTNGVFDVKLNQSVAGEMRISDATGKMIYAFPINNAFTETRIDLSAHPKGLYLVQFRTAEGVEEKKVTVE
jgi:hypothetical protein